MLLVVNIFFLIVAAVVSLCLRRQIAKHRLRIGRISPLQLSVYDILYSGVLSDGTYHFTFTSSRMSLRFHWPCRPNLKLVTFTAEDILYKSTTANISTSRLSSVLWFFPVLFRQTAGPWANAELDDFRIRIFGSDETPCLVKVFRENLVGSMLTGDVLRLDDFGTNVRFSGVTESAVEDGEGSGGDGQREHPDANRCTVPQDGPYHDHLGEHNGAASDRVAGDDGSFGAAMNSAKAKRPQPYLGREQDEVRISAFARGLMLHNKEGRVYSFGALDAQLRRNWTANIGNFVMIAKDARWVRVPCLQQMKSPPSLWNHLLSSIIRFPADLANMMYYPMKAVNLYIPRADITFDNFRLRDAELVMQVLSLTGGSLAKSGIQWQDLFADILANTLISVLKS